MKGGGYSVRRGAYGEGHANRDDIKMQSWVGLRKVYAWVLRVGPVLQAGISGKVLLCLSGA